MGSYTRGKWVPTLKGNGFLHSREMGSVLVGLRGEGKRLCESPCSEGGEIAIRMVIRAPYSEDSELGTRQTCVSPRDVYIYLASTAHLGIHSHHISHHISNTHKKKSPP